MPTLMQGNNPIGVINKSGGGGGHVIQDASGTDMTQRANMQFVDAHLTDDSTNEKTVIENIKSVASADYSSETEDGLYLIPDGDGSVIEPASEDYVEVTADGVKTYATLLNELFTGVDLDKLKVDSAIVINISGEKYVYHMVTYYTDTYEFEWTRARSANILIRGIMLRSNNSTYTKSENGTITPASSEQPSSGTIFTLYYGNKKAVVDLQTTANRCWMSDGQSVESAVTNKTAPTSNAVVVTLPTTAQYGFYYFFLPTSAIKAGKTITITSATVVGSSTNLAQYVSAEPYSPTEIGRIYKISSSAVSSGGQALLIVFTVS